MTPVLRAGVPQSPVTFGDRPGEPQLATAPWPGAVVRGVAGVAGAAGVILLALLWRAAAEPWERGSYGILLTMLAASLLHVTTVGDHFVPGAVRIAPGASALRFAPRWRETALTPGVFSLLVVWGGLAAWVIAGGALTGESALAESDVPLTAYAVLVIALVALGFLVRLVAQLLRRPAGVTLTERGVILAWEGSVQELSWHHLRGAEVRLDARLGPGLAVRDSTGTEWAVMRARGCGSDPAVVAAVVNYFRAHPEERTSLSDPVLAWERFRASFAGLSG